MKYEQKPQLWKQQTAVLAPNGNLILLDIPAPQSELTPDEEFTEDALAVLDEVIE